jgi:DNA-binding response OmpR family regulator
MVCYGRLMPPEPKPREEEARLSGARAEFAGSLPRRLETLRGALAAVEQQPGDADRVKSLLRRVHAVGSAARVLGFASVAEALAEAERSVRAATAAGRPVPFDELARAFDVLPSLVLGAAVSVRSSEDRAATAAWPTSVLLVGSQALADAIAEPERVPPVECERLSDASRLVELVHIVGPDVIVVDGDHEGARDALAKLFADELIEPTPVVVLGSFAQPEAAAGFVELGVTRVLPKPCSPDMLRRTVEELRERANRPRAAREPLGEMNMAGLADRIAAEFKRGLVEALESGAPNVRVPLGEGHDVLAAVWGAVARVRELVTVRSNGNLRFQQTGPEGAVPIAPWASSERRAGERASGKGRGSEGVSLNGRRIVVADDDPAVVWFMAGLLRAVGVQVLEAHDGRRALELAFEHWPDAVVSDVLMPKLDGFALCHEVKRDVALRDVPVILLSWKEDLLQRVRELGAAADGYLRKEAAASAVVERVREVLRARARVEERILTGGEVRGRLDGLTPRLVLELACRGERDARVSVRDAAFLFEAQIRKGRLISLSRSAANGSFTRGAAVLASLLGASAGRFSVEPDSSHCRSELSGSLFELLREPIERARGALRTVTADALLRLERVELDRELLETYLACTPEPAAAVTRRLLEGQSPRDLVLAGTVSAPLLEVVLSDMARRGAILSAITAPASESSRPAVASRSAPPLASEIEDRLRTEATLGASEIAEPSRTGSSLIAEEVPRTDALPTALTSPHTKTLRFGNLGLGDGAHSDAASTEDAGPADGAPRTDPFPGQSAAPAAVSDAPPTDVVPELPAATNGEPEPARLPAEAEKLPFNAEPTPRPDESEPMFTFGTDTKTLEGVGAGAAEVAVGGAARDAEAPELGAGVLGLLGDADARESVAPKPGSEPPKVETKPLVIDAVATSAGSGPAHEEPLEPDTSPAIPAAKRRDTPRAPKSPDSGGARAAETPAPATAEKAAVRAPDAAQRADAAAPKPGGLGRLLFRSAAAGGIAFFVTTWVVVPLFSSDKDAAPPVEKPAALPPPAPSASAAPAPGLGVEDLELPRGMEVAPEQGIIEVETNGPDPIYVDDAFVGVGPVRRVAAAAGLHSVEVRGDRPAGPLKLTLESGRRAHVTASAAGSAAPAASPR